MAVLFGGVMGAVAGAFGGWTERVVMRSIDVMLAMPGILLAIAIVVWLDRGLPQITIAVAIANSLVIARLLHGKLLSLRSADFVFAAKVTGAGKLRLLMRHMLPNALTPVIIQATLLVGTAVIDVAGLGFLGLGPADPSTAEWGTMLTGAASLTRTAPYLVVFPGLAIVWTVVGFNLLGDGLREALDPRLRR
jgi:peptide/nickel transport system permease protein